MSNKQFSGTHRCENEKIKADNCKLEEKSNDLEAKLEAAKQETKRLGHLLKSTKTKQKLLKEEAKLLETSSSSNNSIDPNIRDAKSAELSSIGETQRLSNASLLGASGNFEQQGHIGRPRIQSEEEEVLHDLFFIF